MTMEKTLIDLLHCEMNKETGTLFLDRLFTLDRFPSTVSLISHKTKKVIDFVPIGPDHPRWDEDHWDGEMQLYQPSSDAGWVKILVIH